MTKVKVNTGDKDFKFNPITLNVSITIETSEEFHELLNVGKGTYELDYSSVLEEVSLKIYEALK